MNIQDFMAGIAAKVNPDALAGVNTCFHFNLDGGEFQKTVQVADGKLEMLDGLVGESKCTVEAKSETLLKIVKGEENPVTAFMFGKLKVSNPGELMKYAKILGIEM
jgi:putative sterol carrier protein